MGHTTGFVWRRERRRKLKTEKGKSCGLSKRPSRKKTPGNSGLSEQRLGEEGNFRAEAPEMGETPVAVQSTALFAFEPT